MKLSIIIPTLNEEVVMAQCLLPLQPYRKGGHEVIVVDGGSRDATVEIASALADKVVTHIPRGRATQMNRGAKLASGGLFIFLHADTLLPDQMDRIWSDVIGLDSAWGRFDVRLSGCGPALRLIEWFMNQRSRLTGIATGDQAIFVTRDLFEQAGGYPEIAIMEDIAFSGVLKRITAPRCLRQRVVTSSRRWEKQGMMRTVFRMWYLRLRYFLGGSRAIGQTL